MTSSGKKTDGKYVCLVVLNDNETYSDLDGCSLNVYEVNEEVRQSLANGDLPEFPLASIALATLNMDFQCGNVPFSEVLKNRTTEEEIIDEVDYNALLDMPDL